MEEKNKFSADKKSEPDQQEPNKEISEKKVEENERKQNNNDVQTKKIIFSIAYIFGLLFFIPLIMYPNDESAKFHANQALVM